MAKEIIVEISADGSEIKAEVNGYQGGACLTEVGPIMEALGTMTDKQDKPEMLQHGNESQHTGH